MVTVTTLREKSGGQCFMLWNMYLNSALPAGEIKEPSNQGYDHSITIICAAYGRL